MTLLKRSWGAWVYIAADKRCGCVQAIMVDRSEDPQTHLMAWSRWGNIQHVPLESAAALLCLERHPRKTGCPHPNACPNLRAATP